MHDSYTTVQTYLRRPLDSDRPILGSVKKSIVVKSNGVSSQDYFSNEKIRKQQVEMASLILMLLYQ